MAKIERLFNLVALLLNTRRPLRVGEIREMIPAYEGQSDEAFHRMFERDKAEIRELGFVLEQEDADVWSAETGYRIRRQEALLEDPGLTADEIAALSLAVQAWGSAEDGSLGLLKLSVGAGVSEPGPIAWVLPRVAFDENITRLFDAIARRKRVTFTYRTGGGGDALERTVDPHGLYHRGTWYLSGFDHTRERVLNFKLARVDGTIHVTAGARPDFEEPPRARFDIPHGPWEGEASIEGTVSFAPDSAWWAERHTGARRITEHLDGWVDFAVPVADLDAFAGWLAGFGDRAVALEPPELRAAVVARLRALADR